MTKLHSDLLIERAAKRLAIFEIEDRFDEDAWNKPENSKYVEGLSSYLTSLSGDEIKRIIWLSDIDADYAFDVLSVMFFNKGLNFSDLWDCYHRDISPDLFEYVPHLRLPPNHPARALAWVNEH